MQSSFLSGQVVTSLAWRRSGQTLSVCLYFLCRLFAAHKAAL